MNIKAFVPALALALIMTVSGSHALAQSDTTNTGNMQVNTPEQIAEMNKKMADFQKKIAPIQEEYWAKSMEFDYLKSNPNTKPAEIKKVIDEMSQLKAQLRAERGSMRNAMGTMHYNGDRDGYCGNGGYGHGHRGGGYGHRGGGYGNYNGNHNGSWGHRGR